MSAKLELVWTEDNRSIGILEENDEETNYKPLIMLNFKFLGYNHEFQYFLKRSIFCFKLYFWWKPSVSWISSTYPNCWGEWLHHHHHWERDPELCSLCFCGQIEDSWRGYPACKLWQFIVDWYDSKAPVGLSVSFSWIQSFNNLFYPGTCLVWGQPCTGVSSTRHWLLWPRGTSQSWWENTWR